MSAPMSLEEAMAFANGQQAIASEIPNSPHDEVEIVDFSFSPKPIRFTMDGDTFNCHPILGLGAMQQLVNVVKTGIKFDDDDPAKANETLDKLVKIFEVLMMPESAELFKKRLMGDPKSGQPLDLKHQVMPSLHYVMERHGLRPTQPSSDSSSGSPEETDGTDSTAGVSSGASTPPA